MEDLKVGKHSTGKLKLFFLFLLETIGRHAGPRDTFMGLTLSVYTIDLARRFTCWMSVLYCRNLPCRTNTITATTLSVIHRPAFRSIMLDTTTYSKCGRGMVSMFSLAEYYQIIWHGGKCSSKWQWVHPPCFPIGRDTNSHCTAFRLISQNHFNMFIDRTQYVATTVYKSTPIEVQQTCYYIYMKSTILLQPSLLTSI